MVIRGTSPANEQVLTFAWEGPFNWADIVDGGRLRDDSRDYGLYQVYGAHPVYGSDVLLYIGKAAEQTFGKRLSQEGWSWNRDTGRLTVYVGRLLGEPPAIDAEWSSMIDRAERLLIYSLAPACNSASLNTLNVDIDGAPLRVFHVGQHRSIPAETSSLRWALNGMLAEAPVATWQEKLRR